MIQTWFINFFGETLGIFVLMYCFMVVVGLTVAAVAFIGSRLFP